MTESLKKCAALSLLLFFPVLAFSAEKQRVAILRLDGVNASDLELTLVSHLLRSDIVNTQRFTVLERENIDRILREQSMQNIGVVTEGDAARVGRILNVHKIVIGTLMRHHAGYFLEARLIDVETSCIDNSTTAQCATSDSLPEVARAVAAGICRKPRPESADSPLAVQQSQAQAVSPAPAQLSAAAAPLTPVPATEDGAAVLWRSIGFSAYDYGRYARSGLTKDAWAMRERRVPALAGLIGLVPCASGLLYTRNIGGGMFIAMAEVLAAVGIGKTIWEGGDHEKSLWGYGSLLAAVTLADVVLSTVSATRYNARLRELSESTIAFNISVNDSALGALCTVNY